MNLQMYQLGNIVEMAAKLEQEKNWILHIDILTMNESVASDLQLIELIIYIYLDRVINR